MGAGVEDRATLPSDPERHIGGIEHMGGNFCVAGQL
jgi:hypothetical protein